MKVLILGAGQGKRLLPLTEEVPKALLDIHGRTLVERQIDAFTACGITEFVVITGYNSTMMADHLREILVADVAVVVHGGGGNHTAPKSAYGQNLDAQFSSMD